MLSENAIHSYMYSNSSQKKLVRTASLKVKIIGGLLLDSKQQIKLYVLSLTFLFIIIFIISLDLNACGIQTSCSIVDMIKSNWLSAIMLALIVYCEILRREFEFSLKGNTTDTLEIIECRSESYEHLTFLSTYIIPFLGFSFDSVMKISAYIFLLVIIGVILIKTEKIYANPTLAIFGYKLFRVTLQEGSKKYESVIALTKKDLEIGQHVRYQFISKKICFVREV